MAWTAEALRAQVWETLSGGPIQSVPHNGFPAFRVASEVPEILVIECAWRILRDGVVVVGTGFGDGDKVFELANGETQGHRRSSPPRGSGGKPGHSSPGTP